MIFRYGQSFFAKKDFAFARITVIPAGQQPQMLAENAFVSPRSSDACHGVSFWMRRRAFEILPENVFGGARLAGDFGEAHERRRGEPTSANRVDADGLLLGAALQNDRVQVLNASREFGRTAQRI